MIGQMREDFLPEEAVVALNIKRKETERKVRILAQRTNLSVTEVIDRAAERWSADLDKETGAEARVAKVMAWLDSLPPWPADGKTSKELMDELYDDETGLPI